MKKFKAKEALAIGLPTASLAVSSANYVTNSKKRKENKEFQEKQLEVLGRLTNSLDKVDGALEKKEATPKGRKIRFFQKSASHTRDMAEKGAIIGSGLGFGGALFFPRKIGGKIERYNFQNDNGKTKWDEKFIDNPDSKIPGSLKNSYNKAEDSGLRTVLLALGGAAIGAALGGIVGAVMDVSQAVSRKTTVNARLMGDVMEALKKSGRKEGQDFTREPRTANLMKTKVCLVISRSADTLKLLINTVNDPKLKSLSGGILKNLPAMSTVTEKASDRFNELSITTMTTNKGDATWISSVADRFISAGYPVYFVEVG